MWFFDAARGSGFPCNASCERSFFKDRDSEDVRWKNPKVDSPRNRQKAESFCRDRAVLEIPEEEWRRSAVPTKPRPSKRETSGEDIILYFMA